MADFNKVKRVMFGAPHIEDTPENQYRCNPYYIFSTKWMKNPLLDGIEDAVIFDGNKMIINQFIPNRPIAYSTSAYDLRSILKITQNLKAIIHTNPALENLSPYPCTSFNGILLQGIVFNAICVNELADTNKFYDLPNIMVDYINVFNKIIYNNIELRPENLLETLLLTDRNVKGVWGICYQPGDSLYPVQVCPDWDINSVSYEKSSGQTIKRQFVLSISFYTRELTSDEVVDISDKPMVIEMPEVYADDPTLNECYKIYKGTTARSIYSKTKTLTDYSNFNIVDAGYIDGYPYARVKCSTSDGYNNLIPYKLTTLSKSNIPALFYMILRGNLSALFTACQLYQDPLASDDQWDYLKENYFGIDFPSTYSQQIIKELFAASNISGNINIVYNPPLNSILPVSQMLALSNITSVHFLSKVTMVECKEMFALAYKLKSIIWDESSAPIRTNNTTSLFFGCGSLLSITDSKIQFTGKSLVILDGMFKLCGLTSYTIYTYDTDPIGNDYVITPASMSEFLNDSEMNTINGIIDCKYLTPVKMINTFTESKIQNLKLKNLPVNTWDFTKGSLIGELTYLNDPSIAYLINNLSLGTSANRGKLIVPNTISWSRAAKDFQATLLNKKWDILFDSDNNLKG